MNVHDSTILSRALFAGHACWSISYITIPVRGLLCVLRKEESKHQEVMYEKLHALNESAIKRNCVTMWAIPQCEPIVETPPPAPIDSALLASVGGFAYVSRLHVSSKGPWFFRKPARPPRKINATRARRS